MTGVQTCALPICLTQRRVESKAPELKPVVSLPELPKTEEGKLEQPGQGSGINPVAGALTREPQEEDLYVGPTYPVDVDDDDDQPSTRALRRR